MVFVANATIRRWCKMDINKNFFRGKYIHNMSITTACIYFTLVQSSYKEKGKRCCKDRSVLWIEQMTRKSNSQVNEALNKLQYMGLITIEHTYKPLSQSKECVRRRKKIGSDTPSRGKNIYYIENIK
jgi:hypothetical protein